MPLDTRIKKVLVIGSGPIVIGQAAEFDYAGAQACRILKEAGVVKSRKEGTCIYYYLDPEASQINALITLFCDIREFMKEAPDRSGADE